MRENTKGKFARELRRHMTDAERHLWRHLRRRNLAGAKFRRQHPIGPYVVDFVCLEHRLVVELDGGQHLGSATDAHRDAWLRAHGFQILRFWNDQALVQTEAVLERVFATLDTPDGPASAPSRC